MMRLPLIVALLLVCGNAARAARPSFDAGFFASRHTDPSGDERLKVLGPFFEMAASTQGQKLVAFRPFFSAVSDPVAQPDRELRDYLWPLAVQRRMGDESRNRYGLIMTFGHGGTATNAPPRHRFWLLPVYFSGKDARGYSYRAVFPLGGTIREFAGRDEIRFVLFPLRSTSRLNDLETSNWLWPLISRTTGEGVHRFRFFPFYGRSVREGQYDKRFVVWPIWTSARYEYRRGSGGGFLLFPLYGRMKLEDQTTTWVLPPFFRFTRGEHMDLINCPWPFFVRARGDVNMTRVWPLWGHKQVGNLERTFVLWPIFWDEHVERGDERQHRFLAVPFVQWETQGIPGERPRVRRHKVWPLYVYRREGEARRLRALELWPFGDVAAVERNWAPLWTLYDRTCVDQDCDTEVLWGLFRSQRREAGGRWSLFPLFDWQRDGGRRSWAVLKGLFGADHADSQTRWRVLYWFTFGDDEENAP